MKTGSVSLLFEVFYSSISPFSVLSIFVKRGSGNFLITCENGDYLVVRVVHLNSELGANLGPISHTSPH